MNLFTSKAHFFCLRYLHYLYKTVSEIALAESRPDIRTSASAGQHSFQEPSPHIKNGPGVEEHTNKTLVHT